MPKEGTNLRVSKLLAHEILDWCIVKYGMSSHFDDFPELEFIRTRGFYGTFDDNDNVIGVNVVKHLSTKRWTTMFRKAEELAKTIIHEYQHYLQSPIQAERYSTKYEYDDDPFERKAEDVAERDYVECISDITQKRKNKRS